MKKGKRANKGQFSVIAALLVSVILVTAVISSYTMVRHSSVQGSPKVLSAIGEMNAGIKSILDFTVGYYGSILQVTGNSTYARGLTRSYLSSGLVNVARSHPEWNPSFTLDFEDNDISTNWFMPESHSTGKISVKYSLDALGIEGVTYETSSALSVTMLESALGQAQINVTRDNSEPELGLTKENFWFYNYSYTDSTWELVNPTDVVISSSGVYTISLPAGIDQDAYSVKIEDNRGLVVSAFYSQESVESDSGIPHYTYTFDWESTGVLDIYNSLSTDNFVIELLQNGTMKWLGQSLELTPKARPIPPVSVKAFRVNATISGANQEVPFQVEDWASNYMVPLGLAGNDSLLNNNNMFVFLVNNEISEVTLWWDGNDTSTQTPFAWENVYFNDNPSSDTLENGFLHLDIHNFYIESHVIGEPETYRTDFLRVCGDMPDYGAEPAYVIYDGVVRDIVQQEPEYGGGGVSGSPNFYSQVYVTLPANTPYYTYAARTIFVDSVQPRTVDDLSAIQISVSSGTPMTEDGTSGGYPISSNSTGVFYDGSPTGWDHHWSQIISGNDGAGFMFTDTDNQDLYVFDDTNERGALNIGSDSIEVNPVDPSLSSISFTNSRDLTWYGAVVTFNSEPIYRTDNFGLWVMVENPPLVAMDEYESDFDYVEILSNVDSSADKGSHSAFMAQKSGPDSVYDTLTEVLTGGDTEEYVDILSDVDSSEDIGSHSDFSAQQTGPDSIYDTLTEVSESHNTHSLDATGGYMIIGDGSPDWGSTAGTISFWIQWDDVNDRPWGQHGDMEARISGSNLVLDWGSDNSLTSSTSFETGKWYFIAIIWNENTDDLYLYVGDEDTAPWEDAHNNSWSSTVSDEGVTENNFMASRSGVNPTDGHGDDLRYWNTDRSLVELQSDYDLELTGSEANLRSYFKLNNNFDDIGPNNNDGSGSGYSFSTDVAFADSENYMLDLEVQWTGVPYTMPNEILSIYGGTMGGEDIAVDVWNGAGWDNVFSDLASGWNNVSITSWLTESTFTIRFRGGTEVGDASSDSWQIDAVLLHVWSEEVTYELDLEVQWTNTDYDESNEELCIYVGSDGGENLGVDVWTGSSWSNVFSNLNVGWNNATVSSYLTSSTFTIRFIGQTETGDSTQDSWAIDATLLHTWS